MGLIDIKIELVGRAAGGWLKLLGKSLSLDKFKKRTLTSGKREVSQRFASGPIR
jgi:hypothetical protein